ncbi:MAG TPA: glycosyltransferase family 2 protein [Cyclobacteriaceae bacterium]|nr:glycosyltransferase family 2 protein [Cyclobacteriaceae bacterium]
MTSLFSICIPNFNYARYLKLTCESVLAQESKNYEIVIADNQSTDGSIEFIENFAKTHASVRFTVNPVNLGFAGNLEKVTSLAQGSYFILLSSDDLMNASALSSYEKLLAFTDEDCVIGSSVYKVNSTGGIFKRSIPDPKFWRESDVDQELSDKMNHRIYKVKAGEMLRRCLTTMGNPYYFLTVCYPANLYKKVGGYGGGRMYNPDKWFNWKLFSEARYVYLVDEPLFSYRWHQQNQVALETSFGHLRYLVDEYRNSMEVTDTMLAASGLSRKQVEKSFVKRDIYRHGVGEFVKGRWLKSVRIFFFGLSTYPGRMLSSPYAIPYMLLLWTTPLGSWLASKLLKFKKA